ncbi:hypothetical protein [Halosegnis rubeus]|jgi:hypothetical protein|uniref:Uncharacterized protein n=1 Tax=Halosegnis rubeus TaxID=2212850 RepID=A0A5N5UJ71_9EURY|nr:hypothetical protein [Halosegnis rubeus]KAB7518809.1 hypothetical protein DP108_06480 [Halosegnis rubeus]
MKLDALTEEPPLHWGLAKFVAAVAGFWYGLTHIPAAIEGILFVEVLPSFFFAGLAVGSVWLLQILVSPTKLQRVTRDILLAIIRAKTHQMLYRVGLTETEPEQHYQRLAEGHDL